MTRTELRALAERIETGPRGDGALAAEAAAALVRAFPGAVAESDAGSLLASTDAALLLVDAILPGWDVTIQGVAREPDGHWVCSLRRSRSSDDDEILGIGRAAALPHAICAALLVVAAQHARD